MYKKFNFFNRKFLEAIFFVGDVNSMYASKISVKFVGVRCAVLRNRKKLFTNNLLFFDVSQTIIMRLM